MRGLSYLVLRYLTPHSLLCRNHTPREGTLTLSYPPLLIAHHFLLAPQLLVLATDELSIRVGETLAEFLNATLVRVSFHLTLLPSRVLRFTKIRFCSQGNA